MISCDHHFCPFSLPLALSLYLSLLLFYCLSLSFTSLATLNQKASYEQRSLCKISWGARFDCTNKQNGTCFVSHDENYDSPTGAGLQYRPEIGSKTSNMPLSPICLLSNKLDVDIIWNRQLQGISAKLSDQFSSKGNPVKQQPHPFELATLFFDWRQSSIR